MQNIIEAIEKELQSLKEDNKFKDWRIKDLEEQLSKAKREIEILKEAPKWQDQ